MNVFSWIAILLAGGLLAFFWYRKFAATYTLIVTNVAVFAWTLISVVAEPRESGPVLYDDLAFRPLYLQGPDWAHLHTLVTAGFLHAGFMHLFGNMLILLIAGIPFEERIGRNRFFALYMFSLVAASLFHALWVTGADPRGAGVLSLGASGAVFGVLGGFAATYPRDKFPIFPIPLLGFSIFVRNVPVILGVLIMAVFEGVFLFAANVDGVAHAAHVGGAIAGSIGGVLLKPRHSPTAAPEPKRLDYAALERLAPAGRARAFVERIRENSDHADVQRAWLDRLLVHLRCPQCGDGFAEVRPGTLECEHGHRETYLAQA
ncbi:MAG: rhomboid family intramembrane serine protease [Euryarchaeota archaeon]|nr:rhomboid family intramembrane serine protease [Euryarchaeota archaeon]